MAAVTAQMGALSVKDGRPTLIPKKAPGTLGQPIETTTNIFPVTLKPGQAYFKYDFRVYAVFPGKSAGDAEVKREFSKQTRDDYCEQDRKKACVEVFRHLCSSEALFKKGCLIYDRAALLFSPEKLEGIGKEENTFRLGGNCQTVSPDASRIEVVLKQAADTFQVTSDQLKTVVNADFKKTDKALMEVLNLATSQTAFFSSNFIVYGNGNIYLFDPSQYGFTEQDAPPIGRDKYVGIGISKTVKVLEGPNALPGKPDYKAALVADVKKTAFHVDNQPLHEKIHSMWDRMPQPEVMARELRDLKCLTTYRQKKATVTIGGFTSDPIGQCTFVNSAGARQPVIAYFQQKYKATVRNVNLPGVVDKYTKAVYPPELLIVAPNQRVKSSQASKGVVEALIKVSATQPENRLRQTVRLTGALNLSTPEAEKAGISLAKDAKPITMTARKLPPVSLTGGGGAKMSGPNWRGAAKFLLPATCEKWAAVCIYNPSDRRVGPDCFDKFISNLISLGRGKGMNITNPLIKKAVPTGRDPLEAVRTLMNEAAGAGCTFFFSICDDRTNDHNEMKMLETKLQIVTQEVMLSKAQKVIEKNQSQTFENILMKMNEKLGGKNHVVTPDNSIIHAQDTLVIGLTIQQPKGMSAKEMEGGSRPTVPAIIGISANNGKLVAGNQQARDVAAQQYFTAFYKFAHPTGWAEGETQTETLTNLIVTALKQFKENRGKIPNKVIVFRGGVSEGQLSHLASVERDIFINAFHSLNASYNPTFAIIAVSKEHSERFYPKVFPTAPPPGSRPGAKVDQNLPPGVVVDRVVVNPEYNEFYLQSHKALQGTAKATKYFLVHEPGTLTMDMAQQMTNALTHLHSIVNSTTAIPTPLYVAEESIKRGTEQFHHINGNRDYYDLDQLNKELTANGRLIGLRFNA